MPRPDPIVVAINGPTLRHVRRGLRITPARLAAEVDVSTSYIRQMELGHVRTVSGEVYDRLCDRLRVDQRVLLANPHDPQTMAYFAHQHAAAPPAQAAPVPHDDALDAPDAEDDALDAPDAEDDALDAPDAEDQPVSAVAKSLAS